MTLLLLSYVTWIVYYSIYIDSFFIDHHTEIVWPSDMNDGELARIQDKIYCTSFCLFMLQHLIFAFSYLRVAIIFKLVFSVMPELA